MKISNLKIAIVGLGVSGLSSLKLLNYLENHITCVNSGEISSWKNLDLINELSNELIEQDHFTEAMYDYTRFDAVILSPGISKDQDFVKRLIKNEIKVFGEIELAYQVIKNDSSKIISVTGTNGKTSTVTMINELICSSGYKTFLGGNIGMPLADYALKRLKTSNVVDYIILELSSFQLETIIDFKSDTACILNLSAHHGERYKEFVDYVFAKEQIFNGIKNSNKKIIRTTDLELLKKNNSESYNQIDENQLSNLDNIVLKDFSLVGYHNRINLNFALELIYSLNIKLNNLQKCIKSMRGVAHRLEHVNLQKENFKVFNDAKSTNWDATLTAICSVNSDFPEAKKKLILGGKLRGENDSIIPHFKEIISKVDFLYLFGESAQKISEELKSLDYQNYCKVERLEDVIKLSSSHDFSGVLIFSPAFPSFDQFSSYSQRGELFCSLITKALLS